ncbi:cytochrome b5 [Leptinotarsa decemlineata]|uniref:cytochrome b5 n=1 Tax=Leptinotarsa decemlineata TaxID=7539 RepID=UPI003D309D9A
MSLKQFSTKEIEEHNDNKSTWVVIHNKVYDLTTFLNEHPGGEEVLLEQAGKNASEAFEDVGHSSDARELMNKYQIGELIESERKEVHSKNVDWGTPSDESESTNQSSFKSWAVPVILGILATILYRTYFQS